MPRDGSPRLFLETALLGCFYCVENRSDFVQVFAVELVRHQHDLQFLLLVPVDPKQKGHERFQFCAETARRCSPRHQSVTA